MRKKKISFSNSPIILFKKLKQSIAVSKKTGDFYAVPPDTFRALSKWDKQLRRHPRLLSKKETLSMAETCGIPPKIAKLFPAYRGAGTAGNDRNAAASLTDITLNITSQCNLNCVYCWNDQGSYSNTDFQKNACVNAAPQSRPAFMDTATAEKAIDLLVESCGKDKNLVVDFYGGEPLTNLKTLLATVDYCRKIEKHRKVSFHFLLATNGTLLNTDIAKKLIAKKVQIAVSLDGPPEVQNKNRPFTDGKGSYETIVRNLRKMPPEIRQRLVGRATVTPRCPDMVSLYNVLHNLGFRRIELFESEDACHKITPDRESCFFKTPEQYKKLIKEYERLAEFYIQQVRDKKVDYQKTFFNRFFKLMQRLYYNDEVAGGCPAAKGQIAVSTNGDIYPCTSFLDIENFHIGNIHTGINAVKYREIIKKINARFFYCRDCEFFSLCRTTGSCLNINYYFNKNPAKPHRHSCAVFKEKLKIAMATLSILSSEIPDRIEALFGFDPVGKRGNELY